MKKLTRRLSILLALCLLLTVFSGAKTTGKLHEIKNLDTVMMVPDHIAVWDMEEMTEIVEDEELMASLLETMELVMEESAGQVDVHCVMDHNAEKEKDYLLGFVMTMPADIEDSFRDLSQEEVEVLNELYGAIFGAISIEGVSFDVRMMSTDYETYLYFKFIAEEDGETGVIEYYITYVEGTAYAFCFMADQDVWTETLDAMMDTVIIGREARFPGGFVDLAGHWAADDVVEAVELGLFKGNTVLEFAPDGGMTRAMLVQVLYRMEGQPEAGESAFSDVAADAWYADAVAWASENGIVKGSGGKFDPDGLLTREQLAAILWRYAKYEGRDVSVGENTNILSYNDAFDVTEYAIPAMQ